MQTRHHLVATVLFLAVPSLALAQSSPPLAASSEGLGPENDTIAGRVGLWDVAETMWASPGAAPATSMGLVAERRMVGSALEETVHTPADPSGAAVKRFDLLTYNRVEGRWDYVSFDTRVPAGIMPAWSFTRGDGAVDLVFQPFAFDFGGTGAAGQMLRMEQIITYLDADHDVKDQYFIRADGTSTKWLAHRYDYRRRS